MNLRELKELIELVQSSQVVELEIEKSGVRVKIKKAQPAQAAFQSYPGPAPEPGGDRGGAHQDLVRQQALKDQPGMVTVKAPVVGTFYGSPAPDAPPYVEVGSPVKKGQILCIIEAMKLMNEIESECDGKISVILVENGQSVEYGQPLFLIEPASPES
jgi:acetyl-CoA carboxylase biotin carboxyl carrier protein